MTTGRSFLLALVAGVAGVVVGRTLPRNTPSSSTPTAASTQTIDCAGERSELNETRVKLAICMAYRTPAEPVEPEARDERRPRAADVLADIAQRQKHIEVVYVRADDGSVTAYPLGEWPPSGRVNGKVFARLEKDGRIVGPDGEPTAYASLAELAGPDGVITLRVRGREVRLRQWTPDGGAD